MKETKENVTDREYSFIKKVAVVSITVVAAGCLLFGYIAGKSDS